MDYKQKNRDRKLLKYLYSKSHQVQDLNSVVIKYLPQKLTSLLLDSSYVSGVLTLSFANQLAISQCRFILPKLKQQLLSESSFISLKKISPIITKNLQNKQPVQANVPDLANLSVENQNKNKKLHRCSNKSSQLLENLAKNIESEELKNSLNRLATTYRK